MADSVGVGGGGSNGGGGGGKGGGAGGSGGDGGNDEKLAQFIAVTGVASEDIANHWLEVKVFWFCCGDARSVYLYVVEQRCGGVMKHGSPARRKF